MSAPDLFGASSGYTVWQYSTTGTVPGVSGGATDLDLFNGSLDQLKQFAAGAQPHQVTGVDSAGLAVQSQPHTNHVLRYASNGTMLYVTCQTVHGDQVDGKTFNGKAFTTWDQLGDGSWGLRLVHEHAHRRRHWLLAGGRAVHRGVNNPFARLVVPCLAGRLRLRSTRTPNR